MVASTSLVTKRVSKPTSTLFHGVVASAGLLLLAIHLGGLLLDVYMPFKPIDLIVPMRASYRTVAVTFGIVSMYAMVLVLASSWVRKHLGTKAWRAIHLLGRRRSSWPSRTACSPEPTRPGHGCSRSTW